MSEQSDDEAPKREPERRFEGDRVLRLAPPGPPGEPLGQYDAADLPFDDYARYVMLWAVDNDVEEVEFDEDRGTFGVPRQHRKTMMLYRSWLRASRVKAIAVTEVAWRRAKEPESEAAAAEGEALPAFARDRAAAIFTLLTFAFALVGLAHAIVIVLRFLAHHLR